MKPPGGSLDFQKAAQWTPPSDWLRIHVVDAHAAGEPLRVVLAGLPEIAGETILEQRRFVREHLDWVRTTLMWEPRGHADMYGCLVVPAKTRDADFGVLFLHNEGYSSMCGHGIIAVTTALLETGAISNEGCSPVQLRIDSPAGRVTATAEMVAGKVVQVAFENVPSFAVELDATVHVPEVGAVKYDLAFGGAFYAFVAGDQFHPEVLCTRQDVERMRVLAKAIKQSVLAAREIRHPVEPDLSFLYGVIFTSSARSEGAQSRNCCVFADGEVDRSPTGTGVSARAAIEVARGRLAIGATLRIESILDTCFDVTAVRCLPFGPYSAVIPRVSGSAFLTGRHEFWVDPSDPLGHGFLVR